MHGGWFRKLLERGRSSSPPPKTPVRPPTPGAFRGSACASHYLGCEKH
jgi:hypothetical protein